MCKKIGIDQVINLCAQKHLSANKPINVTFLKFNNGTKNAKKNDNSWRQITAFSTNHLNKQVSKTWYKSSDKPCKRNHLGEDIHINFVFSKTKSL